MGIAWTNYPVIRMWITNKNGREITTAMNEIDEVAISFPIAN